MVVVVMPVRMGLITMGMVGTWVGQEHKRPLSPKPMVNEHMRRGEEKSENNAKGEKTHSWVKIIKVLVGLSRYRCPIENCIALVKICLA
jgi:hypothetical protein